MFSVQVEQIPAKELFQQKKIAKNPKKQHEGIDQEFELKAQMFELGKSRPKRGGVNCKSREWRVEKMANVGHLDFKRVPLRLCGTQELIRKESLGT